MMSSLSRAGDQVLFDDRLASILALPHDGEEALAEKWRRLLALLGERGESTSEEVKEALLFLHRHRRAIPPLERESLSTGLSVPLDPLLESLFVETQAPEARPAPRADDRLRDMVDRLDALIRTRKAEPRAIEEFRWESDREGVILWVDQAPREALVGLSIAAPAETGGSGVDAMTASAFRRRAPFRDARLMVAGEGALSGAWDMCGVPRFDRRHGHFEGYRGSASRLRTGQNAPPLQRKEPPAASDAIRQLVHELRTPLNAILGFSEMIDGQYLGATAAAYRARAARIRREAGRLLGAVEDLDLAARVEGERFESGTAEADLAAILERIEGEQDLLRIDREPDLPLVPLSPETAERMLSRLIASTAALAGEGEPWAGALTRGADGGVEFSLARPQAIRGLSEGELLDPAYQPDGSAPAAPMLGLGFALRLVRGLARAAGGDLIFEEDRVRLQLPATPKQAATR